MKFIAYLFFSKFLSKNQKKNCLQKMLGILENRWPISRICINELELVCFCMFVSGGLSSVMAAPLLYF